MDDDAYDVVTLFEHVAEIAVSPVVSEGMSREERTHEAVAVVEERRQLVKYLIESLNRYPGR